MFRQGCIALSALGAILISVLIPSSVAAQTRVTRIMVIDKDVSVRNRSGREVPVQLAQVLATTKEKGDWLWVPSMRGWISKEKTLLLSKAEREFSDIIRKNPPAKLRAPAYHHRAVARFANGQYDRAVDDYTTAISISSNPEMYVNRGIAYRELGKLDRSIRDYNRALQKRPRFAKALNERGRIFLMQQKLDQALLDFDAAIRIKKDYAEAMDHRGNVYWKQGKVAEAEKDYLAAERLQQGLPEVYLNLGTVAKHKEKYQEAVTRYKQGLRIQPDFKQIHNDLAWLLATCPEASVRDPESAVKFATVACQLTRYKDANTLDTLAAALAADGKYDDAVRRIEQAIRLSNEDSKPQMNVRKQMYLAKESFVERR